MGTGQKSVQERFAKSNGFNPNRTLGTRTSLPPAPPKPVQEVYSFHEPDSPDNIVFTDEEIGGIPQIKGGTLEKLVQRLSHEIYLDPPFTQTFLLTYRTFTSPNQLLNILRARFHMKPPKDAKPDWPQKMQTPIRLRIFNALKNWLLKGFYDFTDNAKLRKNFLHFIEEDMANTMPSAAKSLRAVFDRQLSESKSNRDIVFSESPPKPIIQKALPAEPTILDFSPLELARQLTIIESKLYRAIKPWECLNQSWAKKDKDKRAPKIIAMINRFNQVSNWIATIVVQAEQLKQRVAIVKHIIEVADRCLALNNFNAVMEIISGLQASSVYRLKQTFGSLSHAKHLKMLEECQRVMCRDKNFNNFRTHLHSVDPPCIPYLGVYLTDLTFIEDGNQDNLPGGLINFVKRKQVCTVIDEIQQYQHTPYCLEPVEFIADWLLNVETLTEDECYKLSLLRESRGSTLADSPKEKPSGANRRLSRQASSPFKRTQSIGHSGDNSPYAIDASGGGSSGGSTPPSSPFASPYGELEEIKGYRFYERDLPSNILIEESESESRVVIKAGTLAKLVERLTYEKYPDTHYVGAFLMAYRTFTTSNELLDLLIMRFNMPAPKAPNKEQARQFKTEKLIPIHFRVFNVLKAWSDKHYNDFKQDTVLVQRVLDFTKKAMNEDSALEPAGNGIVTALNKTSAIDTLDVGVIRLGSKSASPIRSPSQSAFLSMNPTQLCNALYVSTLCLFRQSDTRECLRNQWTTANGKISAPNIYQLTQNTQVFERWIQTELFRAPDVRTRAAILVNFIQMADLFSKLRDFHDCFTIVFTLDKLRETYLRVTWDWLEPRYLSVWSRMKQLQLDHQNNVDFGKQETQRPRANTKGPTAPNKPLIPYMPAILEQVEKVNELPNTIGDLINFEKYQALYFLFLPITREQLVANTNPHSITVDPEVEKYLLEGLDVLSEIELAVAAESMNNEAPEGLPPSIQTKSLELKETDISIDENVKPLVLQLINEDDQFRAFMMELVSKQIQSSLVVQMKQQMEKFGQIAKLLLFLVMARKDETKKQQVVDTVKQIATSQFPTNQFTVWTKTDTKGSVYGWEESISLVVAKNVDNNKNKNEDLIVDACFDAKKSDVAHLRRVSQFYSEEEEDRTVCCTLIVMTIDDDAMEIATSNGINVIRV